MNSFRVAVVTDVAGLRSLADAGAWRGVEAAAKQHPCLRTDLITSSRPSDYRLRLQEAVDHDDDLVIGGSFLLSDAIEDAARTNQQTHFVLVDPLVSPSLLPNLDVLVFRRDQAAFLAGALAAMVSKTGVVAGVYGPGGAMDVSNRDAFEHGARYARPAIQVLGAFQPSAAGSPYANPDWGNSQARAFIDRDADVIFAAGGSTAEGAALAAAQSGRRCIGADFDAQTYPPAAPCLLASITTFHDRGVQAEIERAIAGHWTGGELSFGLAERAVGLELSPTAIVAAEIRQRLATMEDAVAAGRLATES